MEFKKIGLKIAYFRKVKGYTQEGLAEIMGVATSYIGAIEAPNMDKSISLTTLFKIADILETPAWKFLNFD
jgi:transcriptional regulator with XRE-family HTH domain